MTELRGDAAGHRLGFGVGLRNQHFDHILATRPPVDWFEAISENFMDSGGRPRAVLRRIAEHYPVALHGVSLSIGSTDPLDRDYLIRLRRLADEVSARWVSDHLCWTGALGVNSHDLLPLPLNERTLEHVSARVAQAQELLGRPLVLENPSTYVRFRQSTLNEPAFLRELSRVTGCWLLLDVNNVYVSCFNAGTDPLDYLNQFPFDRVVQLHLAGHQHCGTHIVDTHDRPVSAAVWQLFRLAWQRSEQAATLLEWDGDVPAFERVHAELMRARQIIDGDAPAEVEAAPRPRPDSAEAVSTPVAFLVPEIMSNSVVCPS
ncbi:uncharacterized protein (UPF0276 family) [Paraburkholderia terricola]|uniref:MNIO family bufferin maturase n=1 Tax=Paraburkholderia terricola TaxID=169427 RepID=UPI00285DE551|nr:DUF692 domain-containing protein [Paraburkholderia terricola]MDR6443957.1 uncharacterized protein (UPF0276 family) [Paraburkholderia terricola]